MTKPTKALNYAISEAWAILPEKLGTILNIASRQNLDLDAVAEKLGRPLDNTYNVEIRDGVAILPFTGPIMRYGNLFSNVSGATSLDKLATDFAQALNNHDVTSIVLNIDSPGGQVTGVNEFANMIFQARGIKPIVAYVGGMGASAAYWLASAADEIVIDATGSVGSIGVVQVQADDTAKKAKAGIKEYEIVSSVSPKKRPDLNTEEGRADVQEYVDAIAKVFVNTVARNRGVSESDVLSLYGQGGLKVGVDAVQAGMADRIGSFEQLIAGLAGQTGRGVKMTKEVQMAAAPAITHELIANNYPAIAESFRLEGAVKERARIQAVEEQLMAGHEALIDSLKYDGVTTGAEAAVKVLSAEKQVRKTTLGNLKADAPDAVPQPATKDEPQGDASGEVTEDEDKLEAIWQNNTQARAGYLNKEQFIAYKKAEARGVIKLRKTT
jgi:signal peptide peptidase SppA